MLGVLFSFVISLILILRSAFEGPATTTDLLSSTFTQSVMSEASAFSPSFVYVVEPSSPVTVNAASSSAANTGSVRRSAADIVGASRVVAVVPRADLTADLIAFEATVAPDIASTLSTLSAVFPVKFSNIPLAKFHQYVFDPSVVPLSVTETIFPLLSTVTFTFAL